MPLPLQSLVCSSQGITETQPTAFAHSEVTSLTPRPHHGNEASLWVRLCPHTELVSPVGLAGRDDRGAGL